MVATVNTESTVAPGLERSQSKQRMASEQATGQRRESAEVGTPAAKSDPDVESARRMYHLENAQADALGSRIETPEQARSLLDKVLQQFSSTPDSAIKAQGSAPSPLLDKLLSAAPS